MVLQEFEQKLERLVEGVFSTAFRGELQPVEIGRKLIREMNLRRRVGLNGIIAPNDFKVYLSPYDLERFSRFEEVFEHELAAALRDHAEKEGYIFVGPLSVQVMEDVEIKAGHFDIEADVVEGPPEEQHIAAIELPDGYRVSIGDRPIVIGRLSDCDIVLHDQNVSRRHAEIGKDSKGYSVTDLGSTNGTMVNGVPVRTSRLMDGDELSFGTTTVIFIHT
ncbi:MAG: FHA domain-containing protein [Actinobacteria bacterium]|nr:FHA domain-containing protein [Actinomycetota bacterium]